jgi:hypothetical protein
MDDLTALAITRQQILLEVIRGFAGIMQYACGIRCGGASVLKARRQLCRVMQMVIQCLRIAGIVFAR